jgi:cytochrome c peroxidase
MSLRPFSWLSLLLLAACCSCQQTVVENEVESTNDVPVKYVQTPASIELPLGLEEFWVPSKNPMTEEKIALGKKLFFDKNLSLDKTVSCASCHDPDKHWSNGLRYGVGVEGREGTRNVPSLLNVGYFRQYFWDGRAPTLETQVLGPMRAENEMAMPSNVAILERLYEDSEYAELFGAAFENGITISNLADALASFERTILSGNAPYDRYMAGDKDAMSAAAIRGLDVFLNRGKCNGCHVPPMFIDHSYYNLGVGMDKENPDLGRYHVFKMNRTKGKFKTPTVRDIAGTAPYMHDGSYQTLEEVVQLYDDGGIRNRYLSAEVPRRIQLTEQEKKDLVTFLVEGLTSDKPDRP